LYSEIQAKINNIWLSNLLNLIVSGEGFPAARRKHIIRYIRYCDCSIDNRGRDRMIVWFTTICTTSANHH